MRKRIVGVGVLLCIVMPGSAQAATVVGQAPPIEGVSSTCAGDYDFIQTTVSSGPTYAIPAPGGVVTEMQTFGSPPDVGTQLALRIFTQQDATHFTPTFDTGLLTIAAGLNKVPARVPVLGGELLGVRTGPVPNYCSHNAFDNAMARTPAGPLNTSSLYGGVAARRMDVAAVIEQDADSDGYGDESQDACDFQVTQGAACDLTVEIDKGPRKKTGSAKARFTFSSTAGGLTFECRVDKKKYKLCESPLTVRKLKDRKHRFRVRGVDPLGASGPADQHRWRVVD